MTTDRGLTDLVVELTAARDEWHACVNRGDSETALLLTAWIDALLDEWNRRTAPS